VATPQRRSTRERDRFYRSSLRVRVEGPFARIERWTDEANPQDVFWRPISRDNITTWYGRTAESRIADPTDPARILSWLICESYNDKGNAMLYRYQREDPAGIEQCKELWTRQGEQKTRIDQLEKQRELERQMRKAVPGPKPS
jgi:hypothetical protein